MSRTEWETLVKEKFPTARIEQRGKQFAYIAEARLPAGWDKGPIPSRKVGEFQPEMVSGGGLRLPSDTRGTGWIE